MSSPDPRTGAHRISGIDELRGAPTIPRKCHIHHQNNTESELQFALVRMHFCESRVVHYSRSTHSRAEGWDHTAHAVRCHLTNREKTMCARAAEAPKSPSREHRQSFDYDAFISYTHRDRPVAAGIQKAMHRIGRRVGRLHALRVFRDATDLTASPDLWARVTDAMDRARYLVVVLSPDAVTSGWVNKEVADWLRKRGPDRLLFVVAGGHLVWDEAAGRFDPDRSDVALPVLTEPGVLATEPFYVDVSDDAPWDPAAPMFREKVTDLAAPIHGKPKYELASEDVREQRRFRRLRRAAFAGLILLTTFAVAAAVLALVQRQEAVHQRNESVARRLVVEAQSMLAGTRPGGDVRALQQVLAAHEIASKPDEGALLDALIARRDVFTVIEATGPVRNAAFSADGQRIAASDGHTAQVWNANTGKPVSHTVIGHEGDVHDVAFSPDLQRVASSGDDGTVRLWDAATGRSTAQPLIGHEGPVYELTFSPDGQRVVSVGGDPTVRQWDAATGQPIGPPLTGGWLNVAVSPDGQWIASASNDIVHVWNANTGEQIGEPITGFEGPVECVAFSPDGHRIVVGSGRTEGTVRVWDLDTHQPIGQPMTGPGKTTDYDDEVWSVAFSPDGRRIVSGGYDGTVRVWHADPDRSIGRPLVNPSERADVAAFSADGRYIVTRSGSTMQVWDTNTGQPIGQHLIASREAVNAVALSPDGQQIVTGEESGMRRWRAGTGQPIGEPITGHKGPVRTVAFSPNGLRIATGGDDGTTLLWDATTGQPIGQPLTGHQEMVKTVSFSPDGQRIITHDGHDMRLWATTTSEQIGQPMTTGPAQAITISPDGKRIATGGADVRLWDGITTRQISHSVPTGSWDIVHRMVFSPDGKWIVSGSHDKTIRLWDADTGQPIGEPISGHQDAVWGLAFSPDGRYIVSGSGSSYTIDTTVRLWDATTGMAIGQPMAGHRGTVDSLAFSPDGRHIVSDGGEGTVRLWPAPAAWKDELCAKIPENMSRSQWDAKVSPDIDYVAVCPGLPIAADETTN
ncbi:toll/interleukin-1 receptor domain-containing protein [Nocardia sp. NPDC057663]|uniref:toll/interleukin-1 receptor domain-containing protein n=1 Tax=Nocardia sp. NPDC057663 TaxID=3346201 RepID=UPI0036723318